MSKDKDNGHSGHQFQEPPAPDPRMAILYDRSTCYFICCEYAEVQQGPMITGAHQKPGEVTVVQQRVNRVIDIHPVAYALGQQDLYPYFTVLWSMVISRKVYDAAIFVVADAQARKKVAEEQARAKEDKVFSRREGLIISDE